VKKSNVTKIARKLFKYNIIRCRGLLANAIIKAQIGSLSSTPVYAALRSIINSKFPQIGELIYKRVIKSCHDLYMARSKKMVS
jgi:pre-mRNA-splicing factor CWC22